MTRAKRRPVEKEIVLVTCLFSSICMSLLSSGDGAVREVLVFSFEEQIT